MITKILAYSDLFSYYAVIATTVIALAAVTGDALIKKYKNDKSRRSTK